MSKQSVWCVVALGLALGAWMAEDVAVAHACSCDIYLGLERVSIEGDGAPGSEDELWPEDAYLDDGGRLNLAGHADIELEELP